MVQIDRGLVLQLIMNLCKNPQSIAAGTGAISVGVADVELREEERAGPRLTLRHADRSRYGNEHGSATAARIFEPYDASGRGGTDLVCPWCGNYREPGRTHLLTARSGRHTASIFFRPPR